MTMFMHRLAEVLGTDEPTEAPAPAVRPALAVARNEGTDRQVELRCLAEQYVCEANAIIQDEASHLSLEDQISGDELAFTMTCRSHRARVATHYTGGSTVGQLLLDDRPSSEPQELSGPEALPDLIISLVIAAGLHNEQPVHLS
ncbi:hypothetical protein [Granulicoccus phenolivorans]|uniref:hypothetical protein n=1 Tax=Granulicoccus phenolivorans TaxID=266854 RepID=UPI0004134E5D|nr:hypothetical protein [Granulicoccus phenolivorans]